MDNKNKLSEELLRAVQKLDRGLALKFPHGHSTVGFLLGAIHKVCDEETAQAIIDDVNREIVKYSGGEDAILD